MSTEFHPEQEVPESFWQTIAQIKGNDLLLKRHLMTLSRSEFCDFFRIYLDLRTELVCEIMERLDDVSEDSADDLADAMVAAGKQEYLDAFYGRKPLPDELEWDELPVLIHVFFGVYYDRFDANPLDDIDLD